MSYATARHTGNGVVTSFALGFTFVLAAHVKVYLDGVLQTTGYTVSGGNVVFTVAPALGVAILARRETSPTVRLVDYVDGSTLTEAVLDRDSQQAFNMAQEALTDASEAVRLNASNKMDAGGYRVTNAGDPVDPQDLATRVWVETAPSSNVAAAVVAQNAASASAAEAAASAAAALVSQNAASASQTAAAGSATAASASQTAAAGSASAAATSATNAANSATSASGSASTATTQASTATTQAGIATTKAGEASTSATNAAASEVAADASADLAASYAGQVGAQSFRNRLINGDFRITARAASGTVAAGVTAYICDRWRVTNTTNQTLSWGTASSQGYGRNRDENYLSLSFSIAPTSGNVTVMQRIEDVRSLVGESTLSYDILDPDGVVGTTVTSQIEQIFGSGGSTAVYTATVPHSIVAGPQSVTATHTIPSVAGKTIGADSFTTVLIAFAPRTASFWLLCAVQMEKGSAATPFEYRPWQVELALCQRYYQQFVFVSPVWCYTTNAWMAFCLLPTTLRAAPTTYSLVSTTGSYPAVLNTTWTNNDGMAHSLRWVLTPVTGTDGQNGYLNATVKADAEL